MFERAYVPNLERFATLCPGLFENFAYIENCVPAES